jgi:ribosomal protein S18 acetylase RimI-like enzyme
MSEVKFAAYSPEHFEGTKALWREAFPNDPSWSTPEIAIPAKLAVQPDLFLVATHQGKVVGTIIAGYDGHRGWLYAVAVLNGYRRRGIGSALMHEAERRLRAMGCRKINLQVRTSNASVIRFYERLGYEIEERVSMGKKLNAAAKS